MYSSILYYIILYYIGYRGRLLQLPQVLPRLPGRAPLRALGVHEQRAVQDPLRIWVVVVVVVVVVGILGIIVII